MKKITQTAGRKSLGEFAPRLCAFQRRRSIRRKLEQRRYRPQNAVRYHRGRIDVVGHYGQFFEIPLGKRQERRR